MHYDILNAILYVFLRMKQGKRQLTMIQLV